MSSVLLVRQVSLTRTGLYLISIKLDKVLQVYWVVLGNWQVKLKCAVYFLGSLSFLVWTGLYPASIKFDKVLRVHWVVLGICRVKPNCVMYFHGSTSFPGLDKAVLGFNQS